MRGSAVKSSGTLLSRGGANAPAVTRKTVPGGRHLGDGASDDKRRPRYAFPLAARLGISWMPVGECTKTARFPSVFFFFFLKFLKLDGSLLWWSLDPRHCACTTGKHVQHFAVANVSLAQLSSLVISSSNGVNKAGLMLTAK